ncbi:P-loop containing nucleoside triphosphate hydrolase protein, partial [Kalaharituber pfeilii]
VPYLVLSATLPPHILHFISAALRLHRPTRLLKQSIDRGNIFLIPYQIQYPLKTFKDLLFVTEKIQGRIPKTMIFLDDRDEACEMTSLLRSRVPQQCTEEQNLILEFSTAITLERREYNLQKFAEGTCRIIICTEACGMGVDIPDIERVIQWQIPSTLNLSVLWQRIGRCARRNDLQGVGIVMVSPSAIIGPQYTKSFQKYQCAAMAEEAAEVIAEIRAFDTGKGGTDTKATRDRNMLSLLLEPPGLPSDSQNASTHTIAHRAARE